jgi:Protein of unknown function (DUF3300)
LIVPMGKDFLALTLSTTLALATWPLESCTKPEQKAALSGAAAPVATSGVPTADELYQLFAPIALFPDNLIAQVLAGSTYPDQITQADTWFQQNSNLKGDELMQAADQESWESSVKALTQFPDVLHQMSTNLSWTSALGDAYFNVPQSVMNAVQVMRQRASQAGNLMTNQQRQHSKSGCGDHASASVLRLAAGHRGTGSAADHRHSAGSTASCLRANLQSGGCVRGSGSCVSRLRKLGSRHRDHFRSWHRGRCRDEQQSLLRMGLELVGMQLA